jgi:hypothetical protein
MAVKSVWQRGKGEGFLSAYFALLAFSFVGFALQIEVLTLIAAACLFCIVCCWFGSYNYRYHTKCLKEVSPKRELSWERGRLGIKP